MEKQESTRTSSESKQITVDVPAERVAEFYAFFGHFLAGHRGRRREGGFRGHRGRDCGHHRAESESETAGAGTEATTV